MSWNGTVYCGHCGNKGHNKRGCTALNDQMLRRIAEDPEDSWAKRHFDKKKGSKVRKCGFCSEHGHNKATCSYKKEAVTQFNKANRHYQEQVARLFEENGVKVGALVVHPELWVKGTYIKDVIGVVTGIDWNQIHIWNQNSDAPRCLNVRFTGATTQTAVISPKISTEGTSLGWDRSGSCCLPVVSPGSGSMGSYPSDGSLSKSTMKQLLEDDGMTSRYQYDGPQKGEFIRSTELGARCEKYWNNVKASETSREENA